MTREIASPRVLSLIILLQFLRLNDEWQQTQTNENVHCPLINI